MPTGTRMRSVEPEWIIVHGLEGSSLSRISGRQFRESVGRGHERCPDEYVHLAEARAGLTPTLYHSGPSPYVGAVLRTVIEQRKISRVGGRLATPWVATWAETCRRTGKKGAG